MRLAIVAVLCAACGGKQPAPASAPACPDVAQHLLELTERDNLGRADPALASGIRGELDRRCREDGWTAERRRCLADAATQNATLRCPEE